MGLTITKTDGTVSSSAEPSTAEANAAVNRERFVLGRALHLTKDGKVVEEDDVTGATVLGGPGSVISDADVEKYGLNESHRQPSPAVVAEPAPAELSPTPSPALVPEALAEPAAPDVKPEPVTERPVKGKK